MGQVVPACTLPTLHPPSPPTVIILFKSVPVHQLLWLALWELKSIRLWYLANGSQKHSKCDLHQTNYQGTWHLCSDQSFLMTVRWNEICLNQLSDYYTMNSTQTPSCNKQEYMQMKIQIYVYLKSLPQAYGWKLNTKMKLNIHTSELRHTAQKSYYPPANHHASHL